jgi:class 3 adenylate cyclase
MTEPSRTAAPQPAEGPTADNASDSLTRGFLFADLRDYTRFVETRGAVQAASLLTRYRDLVRAAVGRHHGSEIKTEGDSFYVVFPVVSQAVECGLAIVAAAAGSVDSSEQPISVGVGIHAGETVRTPDGYVGGPVNIAARICALAAPGEVLVSDTVRALTQTILPAAFEARGRRLLKGVAEPITVFAVMPADRAAALIETRARRQRRRRWILAGATFAVGAAILGGAAWWASRPPAGLPPGPWTIGMLLPRGELADAFAPQLNGVQLAVDEANSAGGVGGAPLTIDVRDETDASGPELPAQALTVDPRVIAVVGPSFSGNAAAVIPITNRAGLLECGAYTTSPALTKPRFGATDLRSAAPDRINFVRLAPSDDIQAAAAAFFAYNDLGMRAALVVDDTQVDVGGVEAATNFQNAFVKVGGTFVRRSLNPGSSQSDLATVLMPLTEPGAGALIDGVYFGGLTDSGAVELRQAMVAAGFGAVPFLTWEALLDGSGADEGSYINRTASSAAGSYATESSIAPFTHDFDARYRAAFGAEPDPYSGAAHACTQVILSSLEAVAASGPTAAGLREAVRDWAVNPAHRFATVLGQVGFDANGDDLAQFVTIFRVDMGANGGVGDWIFAKQADYGPAL